MNLKRTERTNSLAGVAFAALAGLATTAHADIVNYPASAGMVYDSQACTYSSPTFGVISALPGIECHIKVPISLPVGRTLQQISVIYATNSMYGPSTIMADLASLDFPQSTMDEQFFLNPPPPGPD